MMPTLPERLKALLARYNLSGRIVDAEDLHPVTSRESQKMEGSS